jgi:hypothetical protein
VAGGQADFLIGAGNSDQTSAASGNQILGASNNLVGTDVGGLPHSTNHSYHGGQMSFEMIGDFAPGDSSYHTAAAFGAHSHPHLPTELVGGHSHTRS